MTDRELILAMLERARIQYAVCYPTPQQQRSIVVSNDAGTPLITEITFNDDGSLLSVKAFE